MYVLFYVDYKQFVRCDLTEFQNIEYLKVD